MPPLEHGGPSPVSSDVDDLAEDPPESRRPTEDADERTRWLRWGPYLPARQWGTVREDYSADGSAWSYLPHDHARSRAYRWGEDGLLGLCDRDCVLCFGLALWNGRDPILKERLFGLTEQEGNHGEDVKECYYYLDATPGYAYLKALYRYPQAAFPYQALVEGNGRRGLGDRELELLDTGIFDGNRFFDVTVEYAKASPDDILVRVTARNQGPRRETLHVLPMLWFRNTWVWGREGETGYWAKPAIRLSGSGHMVADHPALGRYHLHGDRGPGGAPAALFTDNETNARRLFGAANGSPWVKDAFHDHLIEGRADAVNPDLEGTRAAFHHSLDIEAGAEVQLRLRLCADAVAPPEPFGDGFDEVVRRRVAQADREHAHRTPAAATPDEARVARQARAGLLWSTRFYHYVVREWLDGDPAQPSPPPGRGAVRNGEWRHLYNRGVVSVPDTWEYPWYAAWDLAFQSLLHASLDADFARSQLLLLLGESYMHPSGQIPAYEYALGDVNPPVHAWACWRVYKMTGPRGGRDRAFLARAFQKLLLDFTWWVNRKDPDGQNLFAGGFLGLDNIGVFNRSRPLPGGGRLEQADGTAWMASYCLTMFAMAVELADGDPVYEDMASKFFEHFLAIGEAINTLGGSGLWDEEDGFYYDRLYVDGREIPMRVRSLVGLLPMVACHVMDEEVVARLSDFSARREWLLRVRPELAERITCLARGGPRSSPRRLLAVPTRGRLERILSRLLDEDEFLSPYGIRSLSRAHAEDPFVLELGGEEHRVAYEPGESTSHLFGGNSNWRGPVWFPVNYLIIEALERYHHFYGDDLEVECPTGSGKRMTLDAVAGELNRRLTRLFVPDSDGRRPSHGDELRYRDDPLWRDLVLFYEHFHGDTGRGLGASHQTGWTALVLRCLDDVARRRDSKPAADA